MKPPLKLLSTLLWVTTTFITASGNNVANDVQPSFHSEDGKLEVTLRIGEAIYSNPNTGLVQRVVGYNGAVGGPTLYVQPGDELELTLVNDLPPEPCNTFVPELFNQYHAVDITNLHFHGLHIAERFNPSGLELRPGESYTFAFTIPEGHSGGTFWYHPHFPGSTTLQAGGGALGMLIIQDLPGNIPDEILNLPNLNFRVQFLNFTYLRYDYATGTDGSYVPLCQQYCLPVENRAKCSEFFFENGPVEGEYNTTIAPDDLEYETTLINGVEQPTIDMVQDQWYRVRILYVPTRFRTLEPHFPDTCDSMLLAKDGLYMLETPRPSQGGFMTSGNRADFLVRCKEVGTQEFLSLSVARNSSNWIASQKRPSLDRTLAYFNVIDKDDENDLDDFSNPDTVPVFRPARPCYATDMRDTEPDETAALQLSGLLPSGEPLAPELPIERAPCCSNTSYYDVNGLGPFNPGHRGENGTEDREFDFTYETGTIVDIDFYAPQIHPVHYHINKFQLIEVPEMDSYADYFQEGDFHDVLQVTIADRYGPTKLRLGIGGPVGQMLGHCHFYRHSDRGMAYLGNITGAEGAYSSQLEGTCYTDASGDRSFELVPTSAPATVAPVGGTTVAPGTMAPATMTPNMTMAPVGPNDTASPVALSTPAPTPPSFPPPTPTDVPSSAYGETWCMGMTVAMLASTTWFM